MNIHSTQHPKNTPASSAKRVYISLACLHSYYKHPRYKHDCLKLHRESKQMEYRKEMKWENRSEVMFDYSLIPENQIKKPPSSLQNAKIHTISIVWIFFELYGIYLSTLSLKREFS